MISPFCLTETVQIKMFFGVPWKGYGKPWPCFSHILLEFTKLVPDRGNFHNFSRETSLSLAGTLSEQVHYSCSFSTYTQVGKFNSGLSWEAYCSFLAFSWLYQRAFLTCTLGTDRTGLHPNQRLLNCEKLGCLFKFTDPWFLNFKLG